VNAQAVTDPTQIKANLVSQLTGAVRWTQIMQNMLAHGCSEVIEVGPGKVLQGLFKKVDREILTSSAVL
jgi:[acyl-carrier-protein] S-malonyltransferase